jgi:hypothetical protein
VSLDRLEQDANGDFLYTFTKPWSDGTTGIKLSPTELLEKLSALVPLPRMHLIRYGGCLASHSNLRSSITPTPRQQGVHEGEANPNPAHWSWARLLKRVFAIDRATCPQGQQSPLRLIAALTDPPLIRCILSYLELSPTPPPIEPARWVQAPCPWTLP